MLVLFLIAFVDLVGFGIVIPLLPFYGERFGASPEVITLLMATFSLCQFIGAPLWGRLSDRLGRRPVLVVSLAFSVLSYLMLGFAHALWMLFAARALAGLTAGNIAAAQAYIADVTTPDNRAKGMGLIGAAFGLGFIAGPAIGGLMAGASADRANLLAPALLAAGLSGTALLGTLLLLKESLTPEMRVRLSTVRRMGRVEAARRFLARVTLGRLILLGFLMVASFAAMESTFALWAQHVFGYGPSHTGMLFAYVG